MRTAAVYVEVQAGLSVHFVILAPNFVHPEGRQAIKGFSCHCKMHLRQSLWVQS